MNKACNPTVQSPKLVINSQLCNSFHNSSNVLVEEIVNDEMEELRDKQYDKAMLFFEDDMFVCMTKSRIA